jgi:hypothetical protein
MEKVGVPYISSSSANNESESNEPGKKKLK